MRLFVRSQQPSVINSLQSETMKWDLQLTLTHTTANSFIIWLIVFWVWQRCYWTSSLRRLEVLVLCWEPFSWLATSFPSSPARGISCKTNDTATATAAAERTKGRMGRKKEKTEGREKRKMTPRKELQYSRRKKKKWNFKKKKLSASAFTFQQ